MLAADSVRAEQPFFGVCPESFDTVDRDGWAARPEAAALTRPIDAYAGLVEVLQ